MSLALLRLYLSVQGFLTGLRDEERGQGLTEYALIIALIAVVVIGAIVLLGGQIKNVFNTVSNCLNAPANCTA